MPPCCLQPQQTPSHPPHRPCWCPSDSALPGPLAPLASAPAVLLCLHLVAPSPLHPASRPCSGRSDRTPPCCLQPQQTPSRPPHRPCWYPFSSCQMHLEPVQHCALPSPLHPASHHHSNHADQTPPCCLQPQQTPSHPQHRPCWCPSDSALPGPFAPLASAPAALLCLHLVAPSPLHPASRPCSGRSDRTPLCCLQPQQTPSRPPHHPCWYPFSSCQMHLEPVQHCALPSPLHPASHHHSNHADQTPPCCLSLLVSILFMSDAP